MCLIIKRKNEVHLVTIIVQNTKGKIKLRTGVKCISGKINKMLCQYKNPLVSVIYVEFI